MIARIKFTKIGSAKFIGHLDLLRYFQKAFKRANLDLAYSQGYNRRQITTFASPLGVGLTSEGEYLDLTLNSSDKPEQMIERINKVMTNNIQVVDYAILPDNSKNAMSVVAAADYIVSLKDGYDFVSIEQFQEKFKKFYKQEDITIIKKTKKSEREINLKPLIYKYDFSENEICVYLQLGTGSVNNIKPELVIETFCDYIDFPYNPFAFGVHRLEIYANKSKNNTVEFIALDEMYKNIS